MLVFFINFSKIAYVKRLCDNNRNIYIFLLFIEKKI